MATKKKSTGTKRTNSKKQKPTQVEVSREPIYQEIILWIIVVICALLFLGNFGLGGAVGGAVSSFLFGVFGLVAYIIPILLFVASFFVISNRNNKLAYVKLAGGVVATLMLSMFIELFTNGSAVIGGRNAYIHGATTHLGGGFFGGGLAYILTKSFGLLGAFIIGIFLFVVSIILITEKALFHRLHDSITAREAERRERAESAAERRVERQPERVVERQPEPVESMETAKEPKEAVKLEKMPIGFDLGAQAAGESSTFSDEVAPIDIHIYENRANATDSTKPQIEVEHIPLSSEGESTRSDIQMPTFDAANSVEEVVTPVPEIHVSPDPVEDAPVIPEPIEDTPVFEEAAEEFEVEPIVAEPDPVDDTPVAEKPAPKPKVPYKLPPVTLLNELSGGSGGETRESLQQTAQKLQTTLENFGVRVNVTDVSCGPAVTRYEISPEQGVKVSRIVNLADDIKLNLAAADIRIEAPIPGKAAVGIEVPNKSVVMVSFREMMESKEFKSEKSLIAFAAGRDIAGKVVLSDIARMPHLLIAGATGSGKSVCINTIIMSILYHADPSDVKFIMIDPKVVELSVYNGIPHLLIPVVTDPKKAAGALNWAVKEMTDRYNKFAQAGVRDMKGYNSRIKNGQIELDTGSGPVKVACEKMPQIVVIVDELADLMMVSSSEVEEAICRLAQLARAAGIHLIIATQRPSVNVITGLIKANMPSRIAFAVTSGVDSRTILDMNGAEKLLGKGDMLYYPQGAPKPMRVQGAFVSDEEVSRVCDFIRSQDIGSVYDESITESIESSASSDNSGGSQDMGVFDNERDYFFADAGRLIIEKEKGSIGMLQRNFKIGFNRAARIMDQLEEAGVVGPEEGTKPRRVLLTLNEFEELLAN